MIQAKQARSQQTQRKIILALYELLQNKYFEHISIAELAKFAGVSVGTFYRRFKDKDALLPMLYQEFGSHLKCWVDEVSATRHEEIGSAVDYFSDQCRKFVGAHAGVFSHLTPQRKAEPRSLTRGKNCKCVSRNISC